MKDVLQIKSANETFLKKWIVVSTFKINLFLLIYILLKLKTSFSTYQMVFELVGILIINLALIQIFFERL